MDKSDNWTIRSITIIIFKPVPFEYHKSLVMIIENELFQTIIMMMIMSLAIIM